MSDDSQNSNPQENSSAQAPSANRHPEGGWEVVEEISEELPIDAPTQESVDIELPTTSTPPQLENSVTFEDNNANLVEDPISMSHAHDYANQNLENFEDNPHPSPAGGNNQYYQYPGTKKRIPYLLIGGILLGVIGVIMIAKLTLFKGQPTSSPSTADVLIESTSGSPTPSPAVSPLPTADSLDKAKMKIQVLNGSGVVGAAGKLAQVLKDDDWEKVDTGNAQSYDASGVRIQVKDGQSTLASALEKALEDDYEDITTRETLDEDSEYNAVVTLGKQPNAKDTGTVQGASDSADLKSPSDKKSN